MHGQERVCRAAWRSQGRIQSPLKTLILVGEDREGWVNFDKGVEAAADKWERVENKLQTPCCCSISHRERPNAQDGTPRFQLMRWRISRRPYMSIMSTRRDTFVCLPTRAGANAHGASYLYGQWFAETTCVRKYDLDKFVPMRCWRS